MAVGEVECVDFPCLCPEAWVEFAPIAGSFEFLRDPAAVEGTGI